MTILPCLARRRLSSPLAGFSLALAVALTVAPRCCPAQAPEPAKATAAAGTAVAPETPAEPVDAPANEFER